MISKEVEEAKRQCNIFVQAKATINLVDNIDGNMVFVTKDTAAVEVLLKYVSELEKQIPTPDNEVPVEYQTSIYVDKRDAVMKDKIRDMQMLREFELQQEYKDFEEDEEWKTYKKILEEKEDE